MPDFLAAVARRYPDTVVADDGGLYDLDNGTFYTPTSARDAIGWINAGEWDSNGTNPRKTRLAEHWFHRQPDRAVNNG